MSKLEFHFTPVDAPSEKEATQNPHAKDTTFVPEAVEALQKRFGDDVQEVFLFANEHTAYVSKDRIVDVCRFLKEEQGFTYLVDLGGIDMFTDEDRYEVFYNLVNIKAGKRLRLKTRVDEESSSLPSVYEVFRAAGWNEREAWDMFGLKFEGHPDLRRMYMPEDFEYHPLRKEFPLLGVPGSLPLPPQTPEGGLTHDPFAAAHGSKPIKSYEEAASDE
ncbi:MAG: NADH-quinone oxidoreductase subunit C [Rhodothermales bacterium]|jgi:NADH-quinone oxidoreductase subunit C